MSYNFDLWEILLYRMSNVGAIILLKGENLVCARLDPMMEEYFILPWYAPWNSASIALYKHLEGDPKGNLCDCNFALRDLITYKMKIYDNVFHSWMEHQLSGYKVGMLRRTRPSSWINDFNKLIFTMMAGITLYSTSVKELATV